MACVFYKTTGFNWKSGQVFSILFAFAICCGCPVAKNDPQSRTEPLLYSEDRVEDYDAVIRRLVYQGTPPELKDGHLVLLPDGDRHEFDQVEMRRIAEAIILLKLNIGTSWTALVDHLDDPECCAMLFVDSGPEARINSQSVGDICRIVLRESLQYPVIKDIDDEVTYRIVYLPRYMEQMKVEGISTRRVDIWLRAAQRDGRTFADIQCEYLRWAIHRLSIQKDAKRYQESVSNMRATLRSLEAGKKSARVKNLFGESEQLLGSPEIEGRRIF